MQENDGNSYFFFTAFALGLGSVAIAVQQAADNQASRIAFVLFAALSTVLALANMVSLFVRVFMGQKIEVTSPFLKRASGRFFIKTPWRIARLIDCAAAWTASLALILMCFWIWDDTVDKHLYFSYCVSERGCENIWDAWLVMLMQASEIFTASTTTLEPYDPRAVLYKLLASGMSYAFNAVLFATVVAEGYTKIQDRQRRAARELPGSAANDADPERGPGEKMQLVPARSVISAAQGWYHGDESSDDGQRGPGFEF